jgi:hypothetical protein
VGPSAPPHKNVPVLTVVAMAISVGEVNLF